MTYFYLSDSPTFSDYIRFDTNFTMSWRYTFPEGKFNFLVYIQSNPTSSIRMISSDLYTQIAAQCSRMGESGYYRLGLPRMSCENSGNYTLVASNGIGMSSHRTVQLTILCEFLLSFLSFKAFNICISVQLMTYLQCFKCTISGFLTVLLYSSAPDFLSLTGLGLTKASSFLYVNYSIVSSGNCWK